MAHHGPGPILDLHYSESVSGEIKAGHLHA